MQTEKSVSCKKWWLGKPSSISQMRTLQIQSLARWAQKHQVTQNATPSQIPSVTTKSPNKSPKRQKLLTQHMHRPTNLLWNGAGVSCTDAHGGCWSNNCRALRTSNDRRAPNSFLLLLPLHPKAWKFSGLKVNSSQLVLPHEYQLTGRFTYLLKMGGESSCTDTCLTSFTSVFFLIKIYIYIPTYIYIYYKLSQFISIWTWMQNAYVTASCFVYHRRAVRELYEPQHTGSAFCLAETDLLHENYQQPTVINS